MPVWLAITIALVSLLSSAVALLGLYFFWRDKANFSAFELRILKAISDNLQDYVRQKEFDHYVKSHSEEHIQIQKEIGALRQFKHDTAAKLREYGFRIGKMDGSIEKLEKEDERTG